MSDTPQGPDWWQASDDKWYPPPRPEMPGDADATAVSPSGQVPPVGPPAGPPTGPPTGPPSVGYPPVGGFPPGAPPSGGSPPAAAPSPYGGMPPGVQPPGQQNKTPLYIAIGVVVAAALIGLIVVLAGGDDDDEPTASTATSEPASPTTEAGPGGTEAPTETTEPSGGGGGGGESTGASEIAIVDEGFSNFMGGYDQDERTASYGFIVENTGDETATDINISVSAFDANGTALASASHTVYVLRPGEQMGIGAEFFGENFASEVADVQIQVSEPSDYALEDVPDEGTLTAEGINTTADESGVSTTFTAKSTYAEQIDSPYVYAIYRDAGGNIIGGSYGFLDFIAGNGTTAGEGTSYENIPNIASTEVYLDPGTFY